MHYEFMTAVYQALAAKPLLPELGIPSDALRAQALFDAYAAADVSDCASPLFGTIVTNYPFVAAKSLQSLLSEQEQQAACPAAIAGLLARRITGEHLERSDFARPVLFSASVGGLGYLNSVPQQPFVACFMERLAQNGAARLFSAASLLFPETPPLNVPWAPGESIRLRISWEALQRQARISRDADVRAFCSVLAERGQQTADDLLMLAGLLTDRELEAGPYLLGLAGSQNLPWYFRRFAKDWRSAAAIMAGSSGEPLWPDVFRTDRPTASGRLLQLDTALCGVIGSILGFRRVLFGAAKEQRAEVIIAWARRAVSAFYRYYNYPESRVCRAIPEEAAASAACAAPLLGNLVEAALSRIEFSCADRVFVLQI